METLMSTAAILKGTATTTVILVILAVTALIIIAKRGGEMRDEINGIFQEAIRRNTVTKQNKERYYLFTWPQSQEFVGKEGCHLVDPSSVSDASDDPNGFDSSYMVPESLLIAEEHNEDPFYGHPHIKNARETAESIKDYDGNVFTPVKN